jgi:hypothetical protein
MFRQVRGLTVPYVLFVISALAGAAGFALLWWSRPRAPQPTPVVERTPPRPPAPEKAPPLPKPLRVTLVVDETAGEPAENTITLPSAHLATTGDSARTTTSTTYLVEDVEVELHDFFDSFATRSRQVAHELSYCDLVVRDGHVITRAAMPLGVLMANNPDLVDMCARALVDPPLRRAFRDQVGEVVRGGGVLRWLERHEQALAQPPPEVRVDTANLEVPKPPWKPVDQRGWPFVFEPRQVDDEAGKPS